MNRLMLVVLEVSDLERSARLYREGFGIDLHEADHTDEAGDDRWISGDHASYSWTDGAYLHFALYEAKTADVTTGAQIGLTVDDIDNAHALATAAGATLVHEPRPEPWGRTSRYRDLDGNVISLTQHG
ncbi:MAG: extradiol dioxygenase [Actinomycetia bacterium]|nr:extradiol dioxygenase [Actinomycetes bacterium]